MRYLSVCSGIEAASCAWEPLGWQPVGFSEIDPFPRAVLAHHYPHVLLHGDFTELIESPPSCDVLVGGTPCQAFSVAGSRRSLADARGNLSLAYVMLADAIDRRNREEGKEPCIVVWENVPGVFSTRDNAFGHFLAGLAGEDCPLVPSGKRWTNAGVVLGPTRAVAWRVLDAQHFGVAQRRRRVFVVASARDGFDPTEVLFESEGVRRDSPPSRTSGKEATIGLTRGVENRCGEGSDACEERTLTFIHARQLRNSNTSNQVGIKVGAKVSDALTTEGAGAVYLGNAEGGAGVVPFLTASNLGKTVNNQTPLVGASVAFAEVSPTITVGAHGAAGHPHRQHGNETAIVGWMPSVADPVTTREWKTYTHEGENNFRVRNVVPHAEPFVFDSTQITHPENRCQPQPGDPSHPLAAAGHPPTLVAPTLVRRLTPRECERLQGFPDSWTLIPWKGKPAADCPDGPRYKALGNSMAVPCMRWIGERIDELGPRD